jgi:hypothetical protein
MITNANITKVVAENCPDAFELEDVSHSRGLEIHHGPNGFRSVIVRQFSFTFTEIANLVCGFEKAGCDVDVNIEPCPEDSQVVTLEVELSPSVTSGRGGGRHVNVPDAEAHGGEPQPGIDFAESALKIGTEPVPPWR